MIELKILQSRTAVQHDWSCNVMTIKILRDIDLGTLVEGDVPLLSCIVDLLLLLSRYWHGIDVGFWVLALSDGS
jgi:hypothetical protein